MLRNPPYFPKCVAPLPSRSIHELGKRGTMGQNRDNDKNMPQSVAPSANVVEPTPLGVCMFTVVDDRMDRVIEFDF
jgi:hypothetical protein